MMVTKGVSFNLKDQEQKKLYDYACSLKNFSGYVKELMLKDIESKQSLKFINNGGIKMDLS
jgi:hypothetical protein